MCLRALDPPTNLAAVRAPAGTGVNVGGLTNHKEHKVKSDRIGI